MSYSLFYLRYIVIIAVQDEGSKYVRPALAQIKRLGASRILSQFRASFAFIGYTKSSTVSWRRQVQKFKGKGPSEARVSIVLPRLSKGKI